MEIIRGEFNALPNMANHISVMLAKAKDKVLMAVMTQALGREATKLDAPQFELITHEKYPGVEFISYQGNLLGDIAYFQKEEINEWRFGFVFIPRLTDTSISGWINESGEVPKDAFDKL